MMTVRYTKENQFVLFPKLVLEDNEKIKKLKTIYQKEGEYADFLAPIESFIAYYFYYDAPKLKDVDVIKAVRNIKSNFDKDLKFFDNIFEKEMIGVISLTLRENNRKITKHELLLILGYILWSIDNRKWMGDSRAYLNWLCDFLHLFDSDEKKVHDSKYDFLGDFVGIDEERLKLMKGKKSNFEPSVKDIVLSEVDSAKFGDDFCDEDYEFDSEDSFWEPGGFIQSMSAKDIENKMKTFYKDHDEDMDFECRKCKSKISAHNKNWHDGMCDDCFNKEVYGNEENTQRAL